MPLSTLAGNRASRWWSLPVKRQPELMDDPALPETEHLEALEALRQINARA
jgi:hypothetical protein